jgi:hypothetical protein
MQSYNLIEAKAEQIKGGLLMWVLNIIEFMVFGYISAKLVHSTSRWGLTSVHSRHRVKQNFLLYCSTQTFLQLF